MFYWIKLQDIEDNSFLCNVKESELFAVFSNL